MSEVGNKRPPIHTRFKKGKSGNPRGRPKGSLNLKTDLLSELAQAIVVTERGTKRKITKQQAFIKAIVARAIGGDPRAGALLQSLIAKLNPPPDVAEPSAVTPTSAEDLAIIEAYFARLPRKEDSSS